MPIAFPTIYNLYKLSIIPNKYNKVLIPTLPFIAISGKDSMYIEAECPKADSLYLCEAKAKYHLRDEENCIQHLIMKQEIHSSCKPKSVILNTAAVEQLDEKHYTISFPNSTKVKISCGQEFHRTLKGSFLIIIPYNCYIETPEFTIANTNDHVKGYAIEIMALPEIEEIHTTSSTPLVLNSVDLQTLHTMNTKLISQPPLQLYNDEIDSSIYHTTIPIYLILFGATALAILLKYRNLRTQFIKPRTGDNADTQESTIVHPKDIRVDHSNISSSL